jgi:putative ABC transport system permease protein
MVMNALLKDLRYSIRMLAKSPGFTTVAVLSLALGIGANSTIFSIVDGAFLRPWPVKDPSRLVSIFTSTPKEAEDSVSYPEYLDLSQQNTVFTGVLAYGQRGAFVNVGGQGELVTIDVVSPNYFSVLGVKAALGRTFLEANDGSAEQTAAVISYALWQRRLGGDPSWVGKSIELDSKSFVLLGIAPREFRGLERFGPTDVWATPAVWSAMMGGSAAYISGAGAQKFETRANRWFSLVGRLRPGVTIEQVKAQADTIAGRLAQVYPASNKDRKFGVVSEWDRTRRALRPSLFLMSMVGLVLLIACANVAGLLLVQHERRRREVAMRLALGAGRRRLIVQMLTESGLLAVWGGVSGIALAWWLIRSVPVLVPTAQFPISADIRLDLRVLAFTVVVSLLTAFVFGLVPALQGTKCNLAPVLKGEQVDLSRGTRALTLRQALVAGEIALSVTLLIGSALLLRSLLRTLAVPPGFDPRKSVIIMTMPPPELYGYNKNQSLALYQSLMERLQGVPGVKRAGYARRPPLAGYEGGEAEKVFISGSQSNEAEKGSSIRYNIVSPGYLPTLGTRIVQGRGFEESDGPNSSKVIVINQTMAQRFWRCGEALGQWVRVGKTDYQVVGVVEDGKYVSLHEPAEPYVFFAFAQMFSGEGSLFVETAGDSPGLTETAIRAARSVDPKVPIVSAITLKEHMEFALFQDRTATWLVGILGLLGIFLASVGLYGVISYTVSRRTREIGIRMALGARSSDVMSLVLVRSLKLVLAGVLVGLGCSLGATRFMSSILYGVKPTDPLAFIAGALLVVTISLLASYLPARRATKVEPMVALRYE